MPVKQLPSNPNLEHLKRQAKDLRRDHAASDPRAAQRLREFHPRFSNLEDGQIFTKMLTLSDAQLTIAREAGFASWAKLKALVQKPEQIQRRGLPLCEQIEDAEFRAAVRLLDAGDVKGLRAHLRRYPRLVQQRIVFEGRNYFCNPSLLDFVAGNPIRHGKLPANIVEVACIVLDAMQAEAGTGLDKAGLDRSMLNETLMLVATGSVAREGGVQVPLIHLLCDRGAEAAAALHSAAVHGEQAALRVLLARGAAMDLPVAAALGEVRACVRLLPKASRQDRHLALALAAQFGQLEIVGLVLEAGQDPNRYNPKGGHSHATPLHQAAFAGHEAVVHLLVERGARADVQDVLWQGTPADWAEHGGHQGIAVWLRARERGETA